MSSTPPLRQHNESEVETVVERYQAMVWRYLRVLGCRPSRADDLTQETFLAFLKRPFRELSPQATAAYLRRIAYHRFISDCRRRGRIVPTAPLRQIDQLWIHWTRDGDADELIDHLHDCLKQLTDRARRALELRFSEEASRRDIARELKLSEHGARNLMQRAKRKLRECIERKQAGEPDRPAS